VNLIDLGLGDSYKYAHIIIGKAYTVTLDANDGTGGTSIVSAEAGETIELSSDFTNGDLFIAGWNTEKDGFRHDVFGRSTA